MNMEYYKEGANVIGNVKGDNGLGQSIRIMCRLLDENNEEHVIKDFFVPPGGSRTNDTYDDRLTEELPFDVNIIHVNASEIHGSIFQPWKRSMGLQI